MTFHALQQCYGEALVVIRNSQPASENRVQPSTNRNATVSQRPASKRQAETPNSQPVVSSKAPHGKKSPFIASKGSVTSVLPPTTAPIVSRQKPAINARSANIAGKQRPGINDQDMEEVSPLGRPATQPCPSTTPASQFSRQPAFAKTGSKHAPSLKKCLGKYDDSGPPKKRRLVQETGMSASSPPVGPAPNRAPTARRITPVRVVENYLFSDSSFNEVEASFGIQDQENVCPGDIDSSPSL